MQYKASDGELVLTLKLSKKEAVFNNNGCTIVGQGFGTKDVEIVISALTNLFNKMSGPNGLFKYFQPLKYQYISLAREICKQVGIENINFDD